MSEPLPHAHGLPPLAGRMRSVPEDFEVIEELGFEPDGAGEHAFVYVRKRGANTDWVARQLAAHAGVQADAVSYAGLKDRHAVTEQWFSVHLPGLADPDWNTFAAEGVTVLCSARHGRKLRRGALAGNRFRLVLRDLDGDPAGVLERLATVAAAGVPNYFGEQRFGREGGNLARAEALFAGRLRERDRHKRGLYLSAARSFLFNELLAERVRDGSWDRALPGEVLMLDGTHSVFACAEPDATLVERLARGDVHPTGPLWGRGGSLATGRAAVAEVRLAQTHAALCAGLEAAGLEQERRALRLPVREAGGEVLAGDVVRVAFRLPAGAYATAVLRELLRSEDAAA